MTVPRQSGVAVPGHYLIRLVRRGPWVAAEISHGEDGWRCIVGGVVEGPSDNPWSLASLGQVHAYGRETTPSEAAYREAMRRHAELHDPSHPAANPRKPVSLDRIIPF